jgi:hypothetical protein
MIVTKEQLYQVAVPQTTNTYKAISNKELIQTALTMIQDHSYEVKDESYKSNQNMSQMTGTISIKTDDREQGMAVGFINSYDKSRRIGIMAGGTIWICLNGMFNSEFSEVRKHVGNIQFEIEDIIQEQIDSLEK